MASEKHRVSQTESVQIVAARVVTIEPYASLALNAAVHLMIDERPKVLIPERAFPETVCPLPVSGHHRHILQVAFSALIANRTIMRMVQHQTFNDSGAELRGFRILNGNSRPVGRRRHACHHDSAGGVMFVFELLHCTLAACANGTERRMPAEIG
jgi:hypothetical protein